MLGPPVSLPPESLPDIVVVGPLESVAPLETVDVAVNPVALVDSLALEPPDEPPHTPSMHWSFVPH
jgi:hypothetical protein